MSKYVSLILSAILKHDCPTFMILKRAPRHNLPQKSHVLNMPRLTVHW